jgi:hypothetical protein
MESAFGVDHGISKGLPSALRGKQIGQVGSSLKGHASDLRIAAHQRGQHTATLMGGNPGGAGLHGRANISGGSKAKREYRTTMGQLKPLGRQKRVLP